jgi:hypothetical protein
MTIARIDPRVTTDGVGSDWRAEERSRSRGRRLLVGGQYYQRMRDARRERQADSESWEMRARALAGRAVFARSVGVVLRVLNR